MAKIVSFILLFFSGLNSNGQAFDIVDVTNAEIKVFMNEIEGIVSKCGRFLLLDEPRQIVSRRFFEKVSDRDSLFSRQDIDFIMRQITQRSDTVWDVSRIEYATFLSSSEIDAFFANSESEESWKSFYKKYGNDFNRLSFPFFSIDRNTAIISVDNYCGTLCGVGVFLVFKRKDGKWKFVKVIGRWAS
jgi:hypothetical protein